MNRDSINLSHGIKYNPFLLFFLSGLFPVMDLGLSQQNIYKLRSKINSHAPDCLLAYLFFGGSTKQSFLFNFITTFACN